MLGTVSPISQASEVGQEGRSASFIASQRKKTIPKPWRSLHTIKNGKCLHQGVSREHSYSIKNNLSFLNSEWRSVTAPSVLLEVAAAEAKEEFNLHSLNPKSSEIKLALGPVLFSKWLLRSNAPKPKTKESKSATQHYKAARPISSRYFTACPIHVKA